MLRDEGALVVVDLDEGRLGVCGVRSPSGDGGVAFLVCCYGDRTAGMTSLKQRLQAAQRDLSGPLSAVMPDAS